MIIVHHLEQSRSSRILWLLEELGEDYEVKLYKRDPQTMMAEPKFKALHPVAKAPLVEIDGAIMLESGAIIELLAETRAGAKFSVEPGAAARADYLFWLHYAEGTVMGPIILSYMLSSLGEAAAAITSYAQADLHRIATFVDAAYQDKDFLLENRFTAADIQMAYFGEVLGKTVGLGAYPNLARVLSAFEARPAFQRARARGHD